MIRGSKHGERAAAFDIAFFGLYMIAPVKKKYQSFEDVLEACANVVQLLSMSAISKCGEVARSASLYEETANT